ncbi:MAG: alpha-L-fucosidase [Anaerolineae bacterium]
MDTRSSRFAPTWASLEQYQIPDWYQDGKFGIFIHWGPYCVPAFGNEWYPRNMYLQDTREFIYHQKVFGHQSKFGYKDFIPLFKAEKFDPAAWADLFRRAGARFVVPVAEHHDGFAMYDSALTRWNAARMGPQRDVIGELAAATRAAGMVFGVSSHRAEHWWFFNGGREFDSDVQDPAYADFYGPAMPQPAGALQGRDAEPRPDAAFLEDWLARCCELVDKYQPQLFWFDWWIRQIVFQPYLQRFAAYYYNRGLEWGKGVAINYKLDAFPEKAAVLDIERGQLRDIRPLLWQNDTSVSKNSWGYIQHHDYKEPASIIHDLADVVSKNGALLLNVGPKPDGTIPEPEQAILLEIGRWLAINGEAIYGTRPWKIYGEGPTEVYEGGFTDTKRAAFTPRDVRFTTRGNTLYAIVLGWPADGVASVQWLRADSPLYPAAIRRVELLGADRPVEWTRDHAGLKVQLPAHKPHEAAFVLKIE